MKTSRIVLLVIFLCSVVLGFSQDQDDLQLTKKDSIVKSSWIFGVGINIVDDSGDEFGDLFDVENSWNAVPFPSRLSVGRYFENGLGLEAIATYNRYKEGKVIDRVVNTEDINYLGLDFRVSYDLNQILGHTGFFDPYVGIGAGYTDANNQGRGTYNATVGFRTWFSNRFGLDFNSTGKWAMSTDNATNHIQHAAGVVYQFGIEKGLSRKGMEKLALIQEIEKEQQRVQDSIAAAKKAEEEARVLAERLEKEKEAARLAAEEKARLEAEKAKRKSLEDEISSVGLVYFNLNSSFLNKRDKDRLDKLVKILENNPTAIIKVTSHTDSRGSDKYNLWLSERRVNRTADYILSKGLSVERVEREAFGENNLTNECDDNTRCSEEKHRENRRSEFILVDF